MLDTFLLIFHDKYKSLNCKIAMVVIYHTWLHHLLEKISSCIVYVLLVCSLIKAPLAE